MVSHYYNSLPYTQKHSAANLAYASAAAAGQPWNWTPNYTPPNHQFLGEVDSPHAAHHAHQMYYSPHHMFHSAAAAGAGEWHSPASSTAPGDNFAHNPVPTTAHQLMQHHHAHISSGLASGGSSSSASSGSTSSPVVGASAGATQLNETNGSIGAETAAHQHHQQQQQQQQQQQLAAEGLPSPPITVSGSEISSPGAPNSASSPHHLTHHLATAGSNNNNNNSPSTHNNNNNNNSITANNNHRGSPAKAQYYEWMKKPSYPAQPQPGKTRTKDKYRVVYTDFQRLELEKEYCTSRYITIRRKSELAQTLSLSERQVKIWFQNRRAKERKQNKKGDPNVMGGVQHTDYSQLLDAKTKLEPGLHLQHPLHSMNPMAAMNIPAMRLHPHLAAHSHMAAAAAAHSHQLQHSAVGVGTLSM